MRRLIATTVAGLALAFLAMPAPAATLVVNGSELEGADGVLVNGVSYNVRFVEGSCFTLYGGCDALGDLPFTTQADADAASQALLDQVFIAANAAFDADPELTAGCEDVEFCQIFTPYGFITPTIVQISVAVNRMDLLPDNVLGTTVEPDFDTTPLSFDVFAVWEQAATEVPEPNALAAVLLGSAAGILAGRRRRGARS
jgi:hypothetical protein